MDLLLTGASGFLGRNLILRAPADWRILALYRNDVSFPEFVAGAQRPNVIPAQCDLDDANNVVTVVQKHGGAWDCCLHLAAKVDIPWSVKEPKRDLLSNAGSLLNLLQCIRVRRFVYFSSGAVYDGLKGEVHPHVALSPTLPYAISKLASERYVQFYSQRRRSVEEYLIVRFFGAYGPYEAPHKIFTRLIETFTVQRKDTYAVYGDGQNLIDAMYVADAVDAIHRILAGNHWNDTINLAGGHPITIETLVREVAEALGVRNFRMETEGVANEKNLFWGSTSEMRDFYGFQPTTSLSNGMTQFKDFILARADEMKCALTSPNESPRG